MNLILILVLVVSVKGVACMRRCLRSFVLHSTSIFSNRANTRPSQLCEATKTYSFLLSSPRQFRRESPRCKISRHLPRNMYGDLGPYVDLVDNKDLPTILWWLRF